MAKVVSKGAGVQVIDTAQQKKRKKRRKKGRDVPMNWLERLKRWLLAEEEFKSRAVREEYGEQEYDVPAVPIGNRNLTIRTANIYPKRTIKGKEIAERIERRRAVRREASTPAPRRPHKDNRENFRFPLIPDEPEAKEKRFHYEEEQKLAFNGQYKRDPSTIHQVRRDSTDGERQASSTHQARPKGNGSFRPTEVISPIYGRQRPEQKKCKETVESPVPASNTLIHPMVLKKLKMPDAGKKEMVLASVEEEQRRPEEEAPKAYAETLEHVKTSAVEEKSRMHTQANDEEIDGTKQNLLEEQRTEPEKPRVQIGQPPVFVDVNRPKAAEEPRFVERQDVRLGCAESGEGMPATAKPQTGKYEKPPFSLLLQPPHVQAEDEEYIKRQREILATTLHNFNVNAEVIGAVRGPTVTRYEIQPAPGVKVSKITNLSDDIKLSLAARDIRIEAPIPGRSAVGIEVPNEQSMPVYLRSVLESAAFCEASSPLTVALGMDIGGKVVVADLAKMPHGLIAGSTGSGKSVCINCIILSLLYKATPDEVRLLLIDPKMVELAPYNRIPHLVAPVVTDPKQATAALKWAVQEMDSRYEKFAEAGARDISRYNDLMRRAYPGEAERLIPSIVIVIDELADLMMVAPHDVEESICRIAQKARACGIHLLVATQRPSVDVITGLIKANIPTRIAFSVSSQTDSRTILDMNGAERLLGRGDMLYLSSGSSKPIRLQGPYVSDEEIEAVTEYAKSQAAPNYLFEKEDLTQALNNESTDELFAEVVKFCVENGQASASLLQRNFQIGYNRAARLIDMMEERGFISGYTGSSKPRDVFLTRAEYDNIFAGEGRRE